MSRAESKEQKKSNKKKDILYYLFMLILIGIVCFSGYKVYTISSEYKKGTAVYDEIADDVVSVVEAPPELTPLEQVHFDTRLVIDWEKLKEKNSQIIGWIRSMGTVINYPVVQGNDNDYYLTHLLDGTWNSKGTIFVDVQCKNPIDDFLTIMYGHRMRDKSMFYLLGEYFEERENPYFLEHPMMEFYTEKTIYDVEIFGAAIVNSLDEKRYNFSLYEEAEKQEYIDWILNNNQLVGYDNRYTVTADDHIIMLSTCTLRGSDQDDNRVVVWGKLVDTHATDNDGRDSETGN